MPYLAQLCLIVGDGFHLDWHVFGQRVVLVAQLLLAVCEVALVVERAITLLFEVTTHGRLEFGLRLHNQSHYKPHSSVKNFYCSFLASRLLVIFIRSSQISFMMAFPDMSFWLMVCYLGLGLSLASSSNISTPTYFLMSSCIVTIEDLSYLFRALVWIKG